MVFLCFGTIPFVHVSGLRRYAVFTLVSNMFVVWSHWWMQSLDKHTMSKLRFEGKFDFNLNGLVEGDLCMIWINQKIQLSSTLKGMDLFSFFLFPLCSMKVASSSIECHFQLSGYYHSVYQISLQITNSCTWTIFNWKRKGNMWVPFSRCLHFSKTPSQLSHRTLIPSSLVSTRTTVSGWDERWWDQFAVKKLKYLLFVLCTEHFGLLKIRKPFKNMHSG